MISRDGIAPLCCLSDVPDGGAKGVEFGDGTERRDIIILRRGGDVFAYVNRCPHQIDLRSGGAP